MKRLIALLSIVGMLAGVGQTALIGWEAENGSSFSGTVSATLGADFDPPLSDAGALGGAYITVKTDSLSSSTPGSDARTVSYSIDFVEAGTYDLYARLLVVSGNADDSMFYARQFGDADPTHDGGTGYIGWCTVNGIDDDYIAGQYHWINLSTYRSPFGESPSSFTVSSPGTLSWELGGREDGLWIDALAFGTSGQTFTDAQLNIAVSGAPEPETVEYNPIMYGADPDVLLIDNKVWLYPTSGARDKFYAFSSSTLPAWLKHGSVFSIDSVPWMPSGKNAWAPGVHQKDGVYYLYYSAGPKPSYIGVASSTSPAGPFINRSIDGPLLADYGQSGFEAIDAMVFTDPQTDISYFYAGGSAGSKLRVFQLNPDMISFHHEIIVDTPPMFTEGAFMHYRNGIYYMSYSHGRYYNDTYSVHYCTAPSPTGPWTYQGPLLVSDDRHKGPGHHAFLYNAAMDEWYVFYHRYNDQTGPGPYSVSRQIAIEKMYYNPDGTIVPFELTDRGVGPVWLGNFLRADFNQSGQVEIADLLYMSHMWLTNDDTADMAPVGGDNIVDLQDFAGFGLQWLKTPQIH